MLIASSYFSSSCNDERAVGAVLKFLKNTEMGSREGARERERELEWQKGNDRERDDQFTD